MKRGFAIGLAIGLLVGLVVFPGVVRAYSVITTGDYGQFSHQTRVTYLRGMADGLLGAGLVGGLSTISGLDAGQILLRLGNCVGDLPNDTVVNALGSGAAQTPPGQSVPAEALISLMKICQQ